MSDGGWFDEDENVGWECSRAPHPHHECAHGASHTSKDPFEVDKKMSRSAKLPGDASAGCSTTRALKYLSVVGDGDRGPAIMTRVIQSR